MLTLHHLNELGDFLKRPSHLSKVVYFQEGLRIPKHFTEITGYFPTLSFTYVPGY